MGLNSGGVRTGLRNVSEIGVIPDSAIHHWQYDEGSGTTVTDSIGDADGTINGPAWTSGTWTGGWALDGDGTDDYVDHTTLDSFGSSMGSDFAIAFSVQTTDTIGDSTVFGTYNDNNTTALVFGNSTTEQNFFIRDDNEDNLNLSFDTSPIEDGSPHRVVVNKTGTAGTEYEIWFDGSEQSVTVVQDNGPSSFSDFQYALTYFGRNVRGSIDKHLNGVVDNPLVFNSSLSSQQISNDYDRQPWS